MPKPDPRAQQLISDLAQRHAVSEDAVTTLLNALSATHGASAQFRHPELGGSGQWMQGGMIQIGDMFNNALRAKVDSLCSALSAFIAEQPEDVSHTDPARQASQSQSQYQNPPQGGGNSTGEAFYRPAWAGNSGAWWPDDLGTPSTSGAQNDMRYAYFPSKRRLAVEAHGSLTVFDTLDYEISGVSQQQGATSSLEFSSQKGSIDSASLPVVSSGEGAERAHPAQSGSGSSSAATAPDPAGEAAGEADAFAKIERLHQLKEKGILTEEEFAAKKKDLLDRL